MAEFVPEKPRGWSPGGAASGFLAAALAWAASAGAARAAAFIPEPASPVARQIVGIYDLTLAITMGIFIVVEVALIVAIVRFRRRPGAVPAQFTHNTMLEVLWTAIPALILVIIAVPTYRTLGEMRTVPKQSDLTVQVIGHQWFWEYRYPDRKVVLMAVDWERQHLVVPANKVVELVLTGADVIHGFFVPALGVKIDTNPGRVNRAWFLAEKEGVYEGACSRLCGILHSKMRLRISAVSEQAFQGWIASGGSAPPPAVAQARPAVTAALGPTTRRK